MRVSRLQGDDAAVAMVPFSGAWVLAVVATPDLQQFAMSVPKDRPQPVPGAPLTAERDSYRRLMVQV